MKLLACLVILVAVGLPAVQSGSPAAAPEHKTGWPSAGPHMASASAAQIAAAPAHDLRVAIAFTQFPAGLHPGGTYKGSLVVSVDAASGTALMAPSDASALRQAAKGDRNVRYTESDAYRSFVQAVDDPLLPSQYGPDQVGAVAAWPIVAAGSGGAGAAVCVVDTGVDHEHPDLAAAWQGGHDFVNGDDDAMDDMGHGTHVAGIAAAATGNGQGIAGVAPVHIYGAKVLDAWGGGYATAIALGIRWCADNTPAHTVINLSLGCFCYSRAIDEASSYAYAKGYLLVGAAGNAGCEDCIGFPAALPTFIPVTCTTQRQRVCGFSSTGPEAELAAPGRDILSTLPSCSSGAMLCDDSGYGTLSGTSMSAPHASGVAAMVWAEDPGLTNVQLRARLAATAQDLGGSGRDDGFGFGVVDAECALLDETSCPLRPLPTPPPEPTVCQTPGPDESGYVCAVVPAAFEDIAATGTSLGLGGQEFTAALPLGFTFPFYGGDYGSAYVSSNGFVTFDEPYSPDLWDNYNLVAGAAPAPMWAGGDELDPSLGGSVVAQAIDDGAGPRFIVQWTQVPYATDPSINVTFQIVLHAGGAVDVNFLQAPSSGAERYTGIVSPWFCCGSLFYRVGDFDEADQSVSFHGLRADLEAQISWSAESAAYFTYGGPTVPCFVDADGNGVNGPSEAVYLAQGDVLVPGDVRLANPPAGARGSVVKLSDRDSGSVCTSVSGWFGYRDMDGDAAFGPADTLYLDADGSATVTVGDVDITGRGAAVVTSRALLGEDLSWAYSGIMFADTDGDYVFDPTETLYFDDLAGTGDGTYYASRGDVVLSGSGFGRILKAVEGPLTTPVGATRFVEVTVTNHGPDASRDATLQVRLPRGLSTPDEYPYPTLGYCFPEEPTPLPAPHAVRPASSPTPTVTPVPTPTPPPVTPTPTPPHAVPPPPAGQGIFCDLGWMEPGEVASLLLEVQVQQAGALPMSALAHGEGDPVKANDAARFTILGETVKADLQVTLSAPSQAEVGDLVPFTATVTNNGPGIAYGNRVSFGSGAAVAADLGDMAPGESVTVEFTSVPAKAGTLKETVSVSTHSQDGVKPNNKATAKVTVREVLVDLKAAMAPSAAVVTVGQNLTVGLSVANVGGRDAHATVARFTFPAALHVKAPAGCILDRKGLLCDIGTLATGDTWSVQVDANAATAGRASLRVDAVAMEKDAHPADNKATAVVTVRRA